MKTQEYLTLVDENDREIGTEEKWITHKRGQLHRAVSVFLFNENGQMMIQQRALSKYHSGGLWSNACCGHPRPGESPSRAAERRLWEEMGIRCELEKAFDFIYKAPLDNGLTEYEFDHVFVGEFAGDANPDPLEVCAWKWVDIPVLMQDITSHPENYTFWFKYMLDRVISTCPTSPV